MDLGDDTWAQRDFQFLVDGSAMVFDSPGAAGRPLNPSGCRLIERHPDPAITGKTVITLQPAATEQFNVPAGSYVTLKLVSH